MQGIGDAIMGALVVCAVVIGLAAFSVGFLIGLLF